MLGTEKTSEPREGEALPHSRVLGGGQRGRVLGGPSPTLTLQLFTLSYGHVPKPLCPCLAWPRL